MNDAQTQIGFDQLGLGGVLRQYQLEVPPNQREYAWTEREVVTLFQDFAVAISDEDEAYFLGTIVTIPRPNGKLEVVDGQQRLATTATHSIRLVARCVALSRPLRPTPTVTFLIAGLASLRKTRSWSFSAFLATQMHTRCSRP